MSKDMNWAVLGTGVIANEMAAGLQKMGKSLYAVGNRTHSKGVAFAEKYGIGKVYGTIDEMFTDDNVDIIYITSPHNTHYGFMKKALEEGAGKRQAPACREVDHSQFAGARRDDRARGEQRPRPC